jgi:hypothetical protein
MECRHQRILLGGDPECKRQWHKSWVRGVPNAEHLKRVDELLANFVSNTKGCLMSPSTVSWRRGNKGARLDHLITWNLPPESSEDVL